MELPADNHLHSEWSFDTRATHGLMERVCTRAIDLGIPAVAFTDHLDLMGWQVEPSDLVGYEHFKPFVTPDGLLAPPIMDIDLYLESVDRCQHKFSDLHIVTGAELGQPHRTGGAAAQLPGFGQLERVLGSLHVLEVDDRFYEPPGLYRLWPAADVIRKYLAEVPRMIDGSDEFSVLAHLDYAVRYWPTAQEGPFDPYDYEDEFRTAMRAVARSGRALEMNVGATIRPWVMQWWSEEGGHAITFGSDAHESEGVGGNFAEAAAIAEAHGFHAGRSPIDFWVR
jgi:histidinol-phosphatase (PHP family)